MVSNGAGGRVITGGWFNNVFNHHGNIITLNNGHFSPDQATTDRYRQDPAWQNHEEAHTDQAHTFGKAYLPLYGLGACVGWLYEYGDPNVPRSEEGPTGHDWNPMEIGPMNREGFRPQRNWWDPLLGLLQRLGNLGWDPHDAPG